MTHVLDAALAMVARGASVLPIWNVVPGADGRLVCACPKGATCDSPGKHPLHLAARHGLGDASSDARIVRGWFERFPDASLGLALSRSGLIAIDVDLYKGDAAKLQALEATYGTLPDTLTQLSGSAQGMHLIYRAPEFPIRGELGGVTLRGRNYIVLAPSLHASGNRYAWLRDCLPADLPPAWLDAVRRPMTEASGGMPAPGAEPPWLATVAPERRLYDARSHLEREPGEAKGVSLAGTAFNVCRTTIRAFALRDPKAALALILEVYNPRCSPPYDPNEIARRVVAAYDDAVTPAWGDAYEPLDERRERQMRAFFGPKREAPPSAPAAAGQNTGTSSQVSVIDIITHMKGAATKMARASDPTKLAASRYLKAASTGAKLTDAPDEDTTAAMLATIDAAARAAPEGTTAAQLVDALATSAAATGFAPDDIRSACADALAEAVAAAEAKAARDEVRKLARAETVAPRDDNDLRARLQPGANGDGIRPSGSNIEMILRWSSATHGHLKFNELTKAIEVSGGPFAGTPAGSLDVVLKNWLETEWGIFTSTQAVGEQILAGTRVWGTYDPVGAYLNSLTWDGVPRLSTWLETYCGSEPNAYNRQVGAMWLVSAVARALDPGAKVDTTLILEGKQGWKKSTALGILGGGWFTDTPLQLGDKDSRMIASTRWIVELGELASLRGREVEAIKGFLSARIDDYRPPYGRVVEQFPRRCVFAGTTNADEYLHDQTGARRFWPVRVSRVAAAELARDRDQIWAEAVAAYRAGAPMRAGADPDATPIPLRWWFTADEQLEVDDVAEERRTEDTWASAVLSWHSKLAPSRNKGPWPMSELAKEALEIDVADLRRHEHAIAGALRDAGFQRKRVGHDRKRLWYPPGADLSGIE